MTTRQTLLELIEPAVEGMGYELVELEYRASRRGLVRLYIDSADGIGLDDCEDVSREVSALLDVKDPVPGQYVLEVSSPGENRYLRKPKHFADFAGQRVKLELMTLHEGRRRYTGNLLGIEQDEVLVETDGELVRLKLGVISTARLAPLVKPQQRVKRA
ncbi:MAG: ribosome maturation factor RimP [Gammaproteobacteria bacterium]|nr:ribosome maturation factor RimP [Gammaproteobacteria bacterium]